MNTTVAPLSSDTIGSNSTIYHTETKSSPVMTVARVFEPVPNRVSFTSSSSSSSSSTGSSNAKNTDDATTRQFIAVLRSSLPEEGPNASQMPLHTALLDYKEMTAASAQEVRSSHEHAWALLWSSRIEVGDIEADNVTRAIAAAVNSSMYYLLSAAREDWPFATSPGGIANRACTLHTPPPLLFVFLSINA